MPYTSLSLILLLVRVVLGAPSCGFVFLSHVCPHPDSYSPPPTRSPSVKNMQEGKFSFPIIHCVRAKPDDHRLLNILKQRTEDKDVKKHALEWMKHAVSIARGEPKR